MSYGLFIAQRALGINQAALNIINNNITNLNTDGYSRQRVEIGQQVQLINGGDSAVSAATMGMGAMIENITRNRDVYLDNYYRKENTDLMYYNQLNESAELIGDITNELSETGITSALSDFYDAAQQLSQNPSDITARSNFVQKATAVCDKFNQVSNQLTDYRTSLVGDPSDSTSLSQSKVVLSVEDLNDQLSQLAEINNSINTSTCQGISPNSLLDKRDLIIDKISEYIPITVSYTTSNAANVSINGTELVKGANQVGFFNAIANPSTDSTEVQKNPVIVKIQSTDPNDTSATPTDIVSDAKSIITSGKLGAILDLGGDDSNKLSIYDIQNKMDILARNFAEQVNDIHEAGQYIDKTTGLLAQVTLPDPAPPDPASTAQWDIFKASSATSDTVTDYTTITAANIKVTDSVINDPYKIGAASVFATKTDIDPTDTKATYTGDGSNALSMAKVRDTSVLGLDSTTTEKYLATIVGNIGIKTESIQSNYDTQDAVVSQITQNREATIGVNLDEELSELVKFQKAYEASARMFNVAESILETIINLAK